MEAEESLTAIEVDVIGEMVDMTFPYREIFQIDFGH